MAQIDRPHSVEPEQGGHDTHRHHRRLDAMTLADATAALDGDRAAFERLVDRVLDALPQWVVDQIDNLAVVVEDRPTPEQDPTGHSLLGLYEGVDKLRRGNDYFAVGPDRISIFRLPHLVQTQTPVELAAEIRTTVLHELAHHLGIDDDRLHEIGY